MAVMIKLAVGVGVALLVTAGAQAEGVKWFDMEKCEFCRALADKPAMMENLQWETVRISNGIASLESVPSQFLDDYREVNEKMQHTADRLMRGEEMYLCGFCLTMSSLIREGARHEYVPTSTGGLSLLTSPDVKMQQRIWRFYEKAEEKKGELMPAEGHDQAQQH